uniref:Ep23 n=1 Tax=Lymantria dispar multicapsid nuclear polyhedrosis virus TaxID=10449 RepID=A0A1B1MQP3_NPVLD|nr:ep23 [Lymantria dispar multiple nucleopolyhedrovirus]
MNINLVYPNNRLDKIITISIPCSVNAINLFIFNYIEEEAAAPTLSRGDENVDTRLVSGYETSRRQIDMFVKTIASVPSSPFTYNAYVVSCVRLPFVAAKLVFHQNFTDSLGVAVVQNERETQVWHVFGVHKGREPVTLRRITGVRVNINDVEHRHPKELIAFQGNIPVDLITSINKSVADESVLRVLNFMYTQVKINHERVMIEYSNKIKN